MRLSVKKLSLLAAAAMLVSAAPAFADHHGGGDKGQMKEKMFEKHDANGDGVISKQEFLSHAEEKFTKMDIDENGEVTQEESKEAWGKMKEKYGKMREKRKEMMEGAADAE